MNSRREISDDAIAIWKAGVAAVDARKLVQAAVSIDEEALKIGDQDFPLRELGRVVLVGFGKASGAMAVGFEQALGSEGIDRVQIVGQVNVPDDQVMETKTVAVVGCRPPGENLPTQEVLEGTERILEFFRSAGPTDVCVCLISGGGSALLEKPVDPITLDEFRATTNYLSGAGASIYELNAVRRAISQVKGGRLAMASGGAPVISLIVSDVIGDNLDVIASGPTADPASDLSAAEVLEKFDSDRSNVPPAVWLVIESMPGPQTPLDSCHTVTNMIVGNIKTAMLASREKAIELGYEVALSEPSGNEGDASTVGRGVAIEIAQASVRQAPLCQLMGGETTVTLCDAPGNGGRNQHLVLSALESILDFQLDPKSEYCLLSGGTDGEDGNVSVAGAFFDSLWVDSIGHSDRTDLQAAIRSSLDQCDSHSFLLAHGCVLQVPRTFTNVCDLRIVLTRHAQV